MFKLFALFATCYLIAAVNASLVATHHVVHQPVLAKVGSVVHSVPSATSHQSFTRVHHSAVLEPVVAPIVKTTIHAAPVVKTIAAPAVVPAVHVAPVVHSVPVAPVVHSVPVVHTAPAVRTILPAAYAIHH